MNISQIRGALEEQLEFANKNSWIKMDDSRRWIGSLKSDEPIHLQSLSC